MPRKIQRPSPVRLVKPDSLSERIFLDLRARLQRCEIQPMDRLVDLEVAAQYGVSRMPAREALLRLANEGYLIGTTRGFVTPRLSLDDIRDVFEVRKLLEPHAAASAARDLDDRGRQALSKAIGDARLAANDDDVERLIMANISFRRGWLDALRNERLAITLARFVDHVQTVRLGTLRDQETRAVVSVGLEGLYDAFMRGDAAAARERMTTFMEDAEQAFYKVRKNEIEHEQAEAKANARSA